MLRKRRQMQLGTVGTFREGYAVYAIPAAGSATPVLISGTHKFNLKSEAHAWAFGYIAGLRAAGRKPEGGVYEW